jgi:hypothetical protein
VVERVTDPARRPPRSTLERLVEPPPRLRDRALDADAAGDAPDPTWDALDRSPPEVSCWLPRGGPSSRPDERPRGEPKAALLADPSLPGATDGVAHTLVLEPSAATTTVRVDYGPLPTAAESAHHTRVRTPEGERIGGFAARTGADGSLALAFDAPRTDEALFVEYDVTRNPTGGRHAVDVVVDEVHATARLVVLG